MKVVVGDFKGVFDVDEEVQIKDHKAEEENVVEI